ncbi:MAG: molybdenum cofactor guanylyltransferase [Acidobacteriota bacterium]
MVPRSQATGAVLAGGRSRRMGRDKRLLLFEGEPLLLRAVRLLAPLVEEVLVVCPEAPPLPIPGARHVADRIPGFGVLSGLHAALSQGSFDPVLCIPVDTPCLGEAWLRLLLGIARTAGTPCVPLVGGYVHPIPGAYPRSAGPVLEEALKGGGGALHALLPRLGTVYVGEEAARAAGCDPGALANANTPEEWAALAGPEAPREEG